MNFRQKHSLGVVFFFLFIVCGLVACREGSNTGQASVDVHYPSGGTSGNNNTALTNSTTVMINALIYPPALVNTNPAVATEQKTDSCPGLQDLKEQVKDLQSKEHEKYAALLETQRKNIDWWLSFLAIVTGLVAAFVAIVALIGAVVPYIMSNKSMEEMKLQREIIKKEKDETISEMKADAKNLIEELERSKARAEKDAGEVQKHRKTLEGYLAGVHQKSAEMQKQEGETKQFKSSQVSESAKEEAEKIKSAVDQVKKNPKVDEMLKLRAGAIAASESNQAEAAYKRWSLLVDYAPNDFSINFNAAYWALELSGNSHDSGYLIDEARKYYESAIRIRPDFSPAYNNLGAVFVKQAKYLDNKDKKKDLFQSAMKNFEKATQLDPKDCIIFDNWGSAIIQESYLCENSEDRVKLLEQAEQKHMEALRLEPNTASAYFNLGCIEGLRGNSKQCIKHLQNWKKFNGPATKKALELDTDFDRVRNSSEFQEFKNSLPD